MVAPRDPARPHPLREHGAGLLPARRRGRGGRRRADRAEPAAARRRARHRADLVDRVRAATPTGCGCCRGSASRPRARSTRSSSSRACRSSGSASVAVTPESATSVVLTKVLLPGRRARAARRGGRREAADRRRRAASRAFEDPTPHHDLGRLWLERTGLPMVFAVWACAGAASPTGSPSSRTRSSRRCALARAEPEQLAHEASERYGYPAGFLARYFEKLRYRFGPRERAGLYTFLELARDVGELDDVPELRFVARGGDGLMAAVERRDRRGRSSRRRSTASGSPTTTRVALLESRDLVAVGRAANELRDRKHRPDRDHVHRRPEPQLHEHLRHRLRLLRLLPQPRRHARGLPAAEAGHLQEDRGDARARRHRRAHAGRPPPRPRHRLLRGPLPLDQGALPDPPARALAARGPAHRAPLEADDPGDAHAAARRRPRLAPGRRRRDPRRPRARRSSRRRRRRPTSGSTSCATRTGSACRRPRR